jgi:ubiquinone/menaquinone biosynthesis C-methylase UbiE
MTDINTSIQKNFGNVAENYRHSVVHLSGNDLLRMISLVQAQHDGQLLDVGCGAGHVAVNLAPHFRSVIAYDLTPLMLEQVQKLAQERGVTNLMTQQGNAEQLPYDDHTFDIVTARYNAHHWQHPVRALREILRVLKPNGKFLLSDIVASEDALEDTFLQTIEYLRDDSHVRDHRISEWRNMLEGVGFATSVDMEWLLPLEFESWVQRMATPPAKVAMLKTMLHEANSNLQEAFHIQDNGNFSILGALFVATKPL